MKNDAITGHLLALFVAVLWGTTLISTKILLIEFQPVEILFFRFLMATVILYLFSFNKKYKMTFKQEILTILAGLSGITLYYLLENIALIYTLASNVGVINCCAPFFIAILTFFTTKEKLNKNFFFGFILSIIGISFIVFNGAKVHINPIGDILALGAAIVWGFYSIFVKKLGNYGISSAIITRKAFLYGLIFMIPALFLFNFKLGIARFSNPVNLFNLLFLGIGASALCFLAWNKAIRLIGSFKTGAYLYLIPVVTVATSAIVLKEQMTIYLISGTVLTLFGLFISEKK